MTGPFASAEGIGVGDSFGHFFLSESWLMTQTP